MADVYISPRGADIVGMNRINGCIEPTTDRTPPIELLARLASEECGCPEEVWLYHGWVITIHLEDHGPSEIHITDGEAEDQLSLEAGGLSDLRVKMFEIMAEKERNCD